ncbi:type I polyketide synthase [Streptomyces sp. 150FB]|uniref:type I polyketide synthase n=1 Tax=Streptomyces sp. 150FB TaxID=1576605 RepID=UPI0006978190|nr:type I polyketide synthase [Streptomyces sp. 150FB]
MTDAERVNAELQEGSDGFIAVIGMAGRFPGARDLDEFWGNLSEGVDTISREPARQVPDSESATGFLEYTPARGRLDGAEWFDAEYFGYSAKEAFLIDPQHRVFLECAVEALEDAGQDPDRFPGAIGVYGGSTETRYAETLLARRGQLPGVTEDDVLLGTAPDFLVSRTAQRLGLRGPAIAVQAACATALVALHTAGRGLLAGDCDLALAGGVAVHVPPKNIVWTGADGTLAPDGVCRAFDARGAGTVAGNGVGIVVLKRLSDALADGDHIRAVVRGSAVTNDGAARIGFSAPSVEGQAAAVREAQLAAGTDARTITYVEAHGTATPLGDPIEMAALTQAFRSDTDDKGFCSVGSVKTNIGHADAAAGAAGLIKTVLAMEHAMIPPSLHHTEPNPAIDFDSSPFRVATRLQEWEPYGPVRRAGVSSFAVGGVNAHVVLEQAPRRTGGGDARPAQLLVLSARTRSALRARIRQITGHLDGDPAPVLADVAWTLQTGRREHEHRAFVVVGEELTRGLSLGEACAARVVLGEQPPRGRPVVFFFPGEPGPAEAWRLHASEPAFQGAFDACLETVGPELAGAVRRVARGAAFPADRTARDVYVFALEYALAALWQHWGVRPAAVHGSGVGALVAAATAGAFTLPDVLRLVAERAGGGAGEAPPAGPVRIPVVLGVGHDGGDGHWYGAGTVIGADQWAAESGGTPAPDAALGTLVEDPERILLQVGFGSALIKRAERYGAEQHHPATPGPLLLAAFPNGELADAGALSTLYTALGKLWLAGTAISWAAVHDGERRFRTPLPGYPFERLPYLLRHPAEETAAGADIRTRVAPATEQSEHERSEHERSEHERSPGTAPLGDLTADAGPVTGGRPADDTPLALVLRLFSDALGLADIEPDESFFDLGGDSLVAAKLLAEIREVYPVKIEARSLFTTPTAAGLAELVESRLAQRGHQHSTDEEAS